MLPRVHALALLAVISLSACGGSAADDGTGGDAGEDVVPNTPAAVRAVAAGLYDAVDAGTEVDIWIEAVMASFNIPALTEPAELDARVAARLPAFMKPQTLDLAAAFAAERHVELDNFIAALNDYGVHRTGGAPIDRAFLDERFAVVAAATTYETDQVLAALVLALAAERAQRYGDGTATDPLWGDGMLDPLQTTLLLYAIGAEVSGVSAPPPERRHRHNAGRIFELVRDHLVGEAETAAVDEFEWPISLDELAQAPPCVSLALYGHQLSVTASPDIIYHQQVDVATPPPFTTRLDARLVFLDDYWDNYAQTKGWVYAALIDLAGCNLPRQGSVPGKPLTWSVGPYLAGHGAYDLTTSMTGGDGEGFATWRAVSETTPPMYRTIDNIEIAVDDVKVRAGNLVPGWNTLALVAGGLKRLPDTGLATLRVRYYKNPCAGGARAAFLAGGGQCIDEWYGDSEVTFTQPDEGYRITATDLVWKPKVTGDGATLYEIASGTIHFEMFDPVCTYAFSPATVAWDPMGTVSSELYHRFADTPITFSGSASMFWQSMMTVTCPDGSSTVPQGIGGQFFRADPTPQMGQVLADNYTIMEHNYVFSFHR